MTGRLVLLLCSSSLLSSCEKAAGEPHLCTCDYLTDTDVPGQQVVLVCASRDERPADVAAECVQGMGVGQTTRCGCEPAPGACTVRCAQVVPPP